MKINGEPSMTGLQHMAARAQEARKASGLTEPKDIPASSTEGSTATATSPAGNNVSASGKILPPTAGTAQTAQKPDHATGLERAIERLQENAVKNPEAAGLQHALEMLQRNQERSGMLDVKA